ncbi:hypothetical protein M2271_002908 [Streptomyces sp. LBL]|nr:hypothetical protein [Streptomyces sp. LBL]
MPRGGANRKPTAARRQYFELVRQGLKGAAAARQVGVSTSCGSKWFIEAGSMIIPDVSVSPRFLTQDDRIAGPVDLDKSGSRMHVLPYADGLPLRVGLSAANNPRQARPEADTAPFAHGCDSRFAHLGEPFRIAAVPTSPHDPRP